MHAATHALAEIIDGEQHERFAAIALRKHAGCIGRNPPQCHYPAYPGLAAGEHLQYGYTADAERDTTRVRAQHDCSQNAGAVWLTSN